MKFKIILIFLTAVLALTGCGKTPHPGLPGLSLDENYQLNNVTLGLSFPPVSSAYEMEFTRKHMEILSNRAFRASENWKLREPSKGDFNWGPLDQRVSFAENNHYHLFLTIQSDGPAWAVSKTNAQSAVYQNDSDFSNYIATLARRYSGRIDSIQFGNEWQTDYWFTGSADEFVRYNNIVYDLFKLHSPSTRVVLGGFSIGAQRIMAAMEGRISSLYDDEGKKYDQDDIKAYQDSQEALNLLTRISNVIQNANYDAVDIHLYDDCENWGIYYHMMREKIPGKPILVSEFGGPNVLVEPYSDSWQAQRLKDYIRTLDSIGISEAYYFKLVEGTDTKSHVKSGLMTGLLLEKTAYTVYRNFAGGKK